MLSSDDPEMERNTLGLSFVGTMNDAKLSPPAAALVDEEGFQVTCLIMPSIH